MSWAQISCTCGYTGDFDSFTKNSMGLDLPPNSYQCPECKLAWKISYGPGTHYASGLYIPGDSKIEAVTPEL